MQVPFMDLKRQYLNIKEEIDGAIQNTIDGCAFVSGSKVKKFEKDFAAYCGVEHAIGISSGTSALYVALRALGIGQGDIIITVPYTFVATVEAITMTGARPIFIDIDKESYNISITELKNYIEKTCTWNISDSTLTDKQTGFKVRGVVPVHLYGQMSDMDEIMEIAKAYNLSVLEDAAQAHGASYRDRKAGTIGHAGAFSFYPSKNLGAFGQAGAVITNDAHLAERARMFIDHGSGRRYYHTFEGWNFKMDGLQAAVLDVKLNKLDRWNKARQNCAHSYNDLLDNTERIILPSAMTARKHVYHLYVIRANNRDSLQDYLENEGIGSLIHYPISVHLQDAYRHLGHKTGDFPNAEECADTVLSLPMFPELTYEEIEYVCKKIKEWSRIE
jgi:dTDP-4-amino-4,6-dideoxygalactose transaminase